MRIAYVTETWLPSVDGVVTRLCATIAELHRAGHEVLVIAPAAARTGDDDEAADTALAGATVRTVPTFGFRFLYGGKRWGFPVPRVARALREFAPDVVHVVNPVLLGAAGVIAARGQRRALVASYHTDLGRYVRHYHLGWILPLLSALLRRLHGAARVNLATSTAAAAQLAAHGVDGIEHWPRGVDIDRYHPPAPFPASPPRRPVALYVGRLADEKGLHRLAPLTGPRSAVELVLVGDGPAHDTLRRRLEGARFTETLRGDELAGAYRRADVFVFPSTTDTLGLVLLEALASGLPVVAAESEASRETLAGCAAARLFPAGRPHRLHAVIDELLGSASRETLAKHARAHAERYGWHEATTTLLRHYRHAIAAEVGARQTRRR